MGDDGDGVPHGWMHPDRVAQGGDEWRRLVLGAHRAALPDGPLDGWLFHGTTRRRAAAMARRGMRTGPVMTRDGADGAGWTTGMHWGTAWVADFYAHDRADTDGRGALPALVATRIADLEAWGVMRVDEQSLDMPLTTRLGLDSDGIESLWEASPGDWRACLDILGSVAVESHGPYPAHLCVALSCAEDLDRLMDRIGADEEPCGRRRGPR